MIRVVCVLGRSLDCDRDGGVRNVVQGAMEEMGRMGYSAILGYYGILHVRVCAAT